MTAERSCRRLFALTRTLVVLSMTLGVLNTCRGPASCTRVTATPEVESDGGRYVARVSALDCFLSARPQDTIEVYDRSLGIGALWLSKYTFVGYGPGGTPDLSWEASTLRARYARCRGAGVPPELRHSRLDDVTVSRECAE